MTNLYHYILSLSQPKISNNIISPNSSLQIVDKKYIKRIEEKNIVKEWEIIKSAN